MDERVLLAPLLFLLLILPGLAAIPSASAAVAKVTLSVDQPTSVAVELSYGADGLAVFTGKMTATLAGRESVIITLRTTGNLPDSVKPDFRPNELILTGPGTRNAVFELQLTVSHDATADIAVSVGIQGVWHSEGSTTVLMTNTEHVEVRPTAYYGLSLEPRYPFVSGRGDSSLSFPVSIASHSNSDVEIAMAVGGIKTRYPSGHSFERGADEAELVEIDISSHGLSALSNMVVDVTVHGDRMLPEWETVEVTLNISMKGNGREKKEMRFYAQHIRDRLMLFAAGRTILLAGSISPGAGDELSQWTLPERWSDDASRTIRFEAGDTKAGESYSMSVGVLLLGTAKDVFLGAEVPAGLRISWSPGSLHLDHMEAGIFNVTVRPNESSRDDSAIDNLITLEPQADDSLSMRVQAVIPPLPESSNDGLLTLQFIAVGGGAAMLSALGIGSMEFSRYRFLTLVLFPLYSRIHEENALDNFVRGRIYQYIKDNPGVHFSLLRKELGLNNGVLSYHLHTLDRLELIKSRRGGTRKLFYVTGTPVPDIITSRLNGIEMRIKQAVNESPGITQNEITKMFPDKSRRTISHYVKRLSRKNFIRMEKKGKNSLCYPADS